MGKLEINKLRYEKGIQLLDNIFEYTRENSNIRGEKDCKYITTNNINATLRPDKCEIDGTLNYNNCTLLIQSNYYDDTALKNIININILNDNNINHNTIFVVRCKGVNANIVKHNSEHKCVNFDDALTMFNILTSTHNISDDDIHIDTINQTAHINYIGYDYSIVIDKELY